MEARLRGKDGTVSEIGQPGTPNRSPWQRCIPCVNLNFPTRECVRCLTLEVHCIPYTLHPTPHTLHRTPYTLHPTPYTLNPTPYTLHPRPYTLYLTP